MASQIDQTKERGRTGTRLRKRWIALIKLGIGLGLIILLFSSGRIEPSKLLAVRGRWGDFLLAQGIFLLSFLATILRWHLLLHALGVPARFKDASRLGWVGLFFSQVLPGSTGGDLVKGYYVARERPQRRPEAVLSVLLDRVIGLTALMVLGGLALFFNRERVGQDPFLQRLGIALGVTATTVLAVGGLLAWQGFWRLPWVQWCYRRIPGWRVMGRLTRALWALHGKRRALLWTLLVSLASHAGFVFTSLFLARALHGGTPSVATYFFLVPVGQLAFALPIAPGGLGVGEWAYEALFTQAGEAGGAELAVLVRLTAILWAGVGLYYYLRGRVTLQEAVRAAEDEGCEEQALPAGEPATSQSSSPC
ncbi:MAG: lysylphosphatidylglycerol synthase transmembrane domain-containing protein [Planctomycetota bacterium]